MAQLLVECGQHAHLVLGFGYMLEPAVAASSSSGGAATSSSSPAASQVRYRFSCRNQYINHMLYEMGITMGAVFLRIYRIIALVSERARASLLLSRG